MPSSNGSQTTPTIRYRGSASVALSNPVVETYMEKPQFNWKVILQRENLCNIPHQYTSHILSIISECKPHGNVVLRLFRATELLLLYRREYLIRNNGFMGSGIEIPSHEVIIFNLNSASADRFLEQHSPSIFFI